MLNKKRKKTKYNKKNIENSEIFWLLDFKNIVLFNSNYLWRSIFVFLFVFFLVFLPIFLMLFSNTFIFFSGYQIREESIIKTAIVKQASGIIAGQPTNWVLMVKKTDITDEQKFIKLPKTARHIKIENISSEEADIIRAIETLNPEEQITQQERNKLSGNFNIDFTEINFKNTKTAGLAETKEVLFKIAESINIFFLADLEKGVAFLVDRISEKLNPNIKETESAKIINLEKQKPSEEEQNIEEQNNEYVKIKYEATGPIITEQKKNNGKFVIVSSPPTDGTPIREIKAKAIDRLEKILRQTPKDKKQKTDEEKEITASENLFLDVESDDAENKEAEIKTQEESEELINEENQSREAEKDDDVSDNQDDVDSIFFESANDQDTEIEELIEILEEETVPEETLILEPEPQQEIEPISGPIVFWQVPNIIFSYLANIIKNTPLFFANLSKHFLANIEDAVLSVVETVLKEKEVVEENNEVFDSEINEIEQTIDEPEILPNDEIDSVFDSEDDPDSEDKIDLEDSIDSENDTDILSEENVNLENLENIIGESYQEANSKDSETEDLVDFSDLPDIFYEQEIKHENVLVYTNVLELFTLDQKDKIQVKWINNGDQLMNFEAFDLNNNGKIDYIEWIVPHLSDQIFEIIYVSKAFELDKNQEILRDVYDSVRWQDDIWVTVDKGNYIRATFQKVLSNVNDIAIYARPNKVNGNFPKIEVYPVYIDENKNFMQGPLVAIFEKIDQEKMYLVFLNELQEPTDTFDLKILNDSVDIDFIFDASLYWVGGDGGDISVASNWSTTNPIECNPGGGNAGSAPGASDTAIFSSGCTNGATVDTNWSLLGIQIQSGYTGTITQDSSNTISISTSGWTQADGTFVGGSGNITIDGDYSISGGSFTSTSGVLQVNRSFTQTGSPAWDANSGTVTFDGSYLGNTSVDAPSVTFALVTLNRLIGSSAAARTFTIASGTTIPLGNTPTVTIDMNTSIGANYYHLTNNGTITAGTGTLTMNIKGTFTNNGTITANSITSWEMNGSVENSGTISMTSCETIDLNFHRNAGTSNNGSFTNNGLGSSLSTADNPTMTVEGGLVVASGSTFPNNATVTFDGSYLGNTSVDAPSVTFALVTLNRLIGSSAAARTFTIASGTTIPLGNTPTVTIDMNTSIGANYYHLTNNGTITAGTGTLTMNIKGTFTNNGTITANSITSWEMNGSVENSGTISMTSCETIDLNFHRNAGTSNNGSFTNNGLGSSLSTADNPTMTVEGGLVVASGSTFPANATVNFLGSYNGNTSINAPGVVFALVNINRTLGAGTSTRTFTIASGTTIPLGNSATITLNNTRSASYYYHLTNNGTITVGTGTFSANVNGTFTNANGGAVITKTVTKTNSYVGTYTNASGSTVEFIGNGDGQADTQIVTSFATAYHHLIINSTDENDVFQLGSAPTAGGNVNIQKGIFNIAGYNFSPVGTFVNSATLRLTGNETVSTPTLNAGSIVEYTATSGSRDIKNWTYNNSTLKINGAGGTFTLPANLTVTNINISAGTLDVTASNYNITISGNWSNSGTFTARAGTVTLDGTSQKIFGNTTFYNLTKDVSSASADTLMFEHSKTHSIAENGTLTLKGADGKILSLRSCNSSGDQSDGNQWLLNVDNTGTTFAIDYVDVKDSDASSGKTITHTNTADSGNNLNWGFPGGPSISITDGFVNFGTVILNATIDNFESIQVIEIESGPVDLDIKTSLFSHGEYVWSFGLTNGDNQVKWEFSKDGENWTIFEVADSLYEFDTNVPEEGTRNLYLRLTAPEQTDSMGPYSVTVTIVAS
jgi:hypothetical protein